eukprot:10051568-Lingulodinium_polyedra.AAC.1
MLVLPRQAITVYNAYQNARKVKYLSAEWSNASWAAVRRVVNRTYDCSRNVSIALPQCTT